MKDGKWPHKKIKIKKIQSQVEGSVEDEPILHADAHQHEPLKPPKERLGAHLNQHFTLIIYC